MTVHSSLLWEKYTGMTEGPREHQGPRRRSLPSDAIRDLHSYALSTELNPLVDDNRGMPQPGMQYGRVRWLLTIVGLFFYVVDVWTDIVLAVRYYLGGHYLWTGLTLAFVASGLLVTQIFSHAWFRDDMDQGHVNPEGRTTVCGITKVGLAVLHLFGMGIFTRYFQLLQRGFTVVWKKRNSYSVEERREVHQSLFWMATDLSMLKLFEAFLESVPQLLLQLYILLDHVEFSVLQCISIAFSFFNIAFSLVDYRRCMRRSLPHIREMPSGLPTVVYLLYKLCTVSSLILSYALLLMLSVYTTVALAVLWLLGTAWTFWLRTDFCRSKGLEYLYRAVIGVILTFTFFNVKGQDIKVEMILYYVFHSFLNIAALLLVAMLRPELQADPSLMAVSGFIFGGSLLGLVCLFLYYRYLHPKGMLREADEVDGLQMETESSRRIMNFLQP